jgi:hypothetical protein
MRLFSKFHDIYDPLFKYGMSDKSFVFNRVQEEFEWKKPHGSVPCSEVELHGIKWYIYYEFVGFCGKLYPMVRFESFSSVTTKTVYAYNLQELCDHFPLFAKYKDIKRTRKDRYQYKDYGRRLFFDIADWFENLHQGRYSYVDPKPFLTLFREKRCAYFYVKSQRRARAMVTLYPLLKEIFFHRNFVSVMEMFQQLEMYLLNDLASLDIVKALPISDDLKAQTHGFDKWSFRKESSKKSVT